MYVVVRIRSNNDAFIKDAFTLGSLHWNNRDGKLLHIKFSMFSVRTS